MNDPAVIGFNYRLHKHVLPDQVPILFHDKIQFFHKRRIISKYMEHIMLHASRPVHVPKGFTDKVFYFCVIFFSF